MAISRVVTLTDVLAVPDYVEANIVLHGHCLVHAPRMRQICHQRRRGGGVFVWREVGDVRGAGTGG
jgi:hypothetical protein